VLQHNGIYFLRFASSLHPYSGFLPRRVHRKPTNRDATSVTSVDVQDSKLVPLAYSVISRILFVDSFHSFVQFNGFRKLARGLQQLRFSQHLSCLNLPTTRPTAVIGKHQHIHHGSYSRKQMLSHLGVSQSAASARDSFKQHITVQNGLRTA